MIFASGIAPHLRAQITVPVMMRQVIYSLLPGIAAYIWFFGIGVALNCLIAAAVVMLTEAIALRLRRRPVKLFLFDYSAIVTAILLALCLPVLTPWWVTASGAFFAIAIAKHLYGGLGFNVFNPAMAGYVAILVSFPEYMTHWTAPNIGDIDYQPLAAVATLQYIFMGVLPDGLTIDAISRATPLDTVKTELGMMLTIGEIRANPLFGDFGGRGWEWINGAYALGGFWLLFRGIIRWHVPVAVIGGLLLMAGGGYIIDSATHPGAGFHIFSGGALLCAFFIATDPVTCTTTNTGRLIYGAGIGVLIYVIRNWGSYADGVAFAVLLMNMTVPLIDRYTRPKVYGRSPTKKQQPTHG
ncbi:MAG: RnfABCDGE type electron transport complex subunit D [Gammaproteobacteria bacterium]|nr:RnfABCDGE type electron transport complex subunit D [Gammaproteobacteria bacterium]